MKEGTIAEQAAGLVQRDGTIAEQADAIAQRDVTIAEQAAAVVEKDGTIAGHTATIAALERTTAELEGLLVGGRGPGGHCRPHLLPACVTCPRLCAPERRFVEHAMSCAGCTWGAAVRRQAAERAIVRQRDEALLARDAALAERQRQLVRLRAGLFSAALSARWRRGRVGGGFG